MSPYNRGPAVPAAVPAIFSVLFISDKSGAHASDNNRQARFYRLTRKGQRQLKDETQQWERMTGAVAKILASEA